MSLKVFIIDSIANEYLKWKYKKRISWNKERKEKSFNQYIGI